MPVIEQRPQSEYIEKFLKALKPYLPPLPKSPSTEETREAWQKVYTEPYPGMNLLPFAPNIDLNELAKAIYGTVSNILASDATMGMVNPLSIRAFHGSPYKFSKFENKAIGTGEGAQAFGYGHYLTSSPEVAKQYTRYPKYVESSLGKIEINKILDNAPISVLGTMRDVLEGHSNPDSIRNAISKVDELIKKTNPNDLKSFSVKSLKDTRILLEDAISGRLKPESHIYETTIHKGKQPGEYTYLEWDKTIDDKTIQKIADALDKSPELGYEGRIISQGLKQTIYHAGSANRPYNSWLYSFLATNLRGEKNASEFLNKLGYSGIKYPTGTLSGIKGSKEYNYVVFNPEDITIEKILNE